MSSRAAPVDQGLVPPSAQGVMLETQDPAPRWDPCMEPASPSACVSASLYVCHKKKSEFSRISSPTPKFPS